MPAALAQERLHVLPHNLARFELSLHGPKRGHELELSRDTILTRLP